MKSRQGVVSQRIVHFARGKTARRTTTRYWMEGLKRLGVLLRPERQQCAGLVVILTRKRTMGAFRIFRRFREIKIRGRQFALQPDRRPRVRPLAFPRFSQPQARPLAFPLLSQPRARLPGDYRPRVRPLLFPRRTHLNQQPARLQHRARLRGHIRHRVRRLSRF